MKEFGLAAELEGTVVSNGRLGGWFEAHGFCNPQKEKADQQQALVVG